MGVVVGVAAREGGETCAAAALWRLPCYELRHSFPASRGVAWKKPQSDWSLMMSLSRDQELDPQLEN